MRKIWSQLGVESPWNYEALRLAEEGMDEDDAKDHVIMEWMMDGDLRPLLASIKENEVLSGPVLELLAQMLENGELTFRGRGRGRPRSPEAGATAQLAADMYEDFLKHYRVGSDALSQATGNVIVTSPESVRQAVTAKRKATPNPVVWRQGQPQVSPHQSVPQHHGGRITPALPVSLRYWLYSSTYLSAHCAGPVID